MRLDLKENIVFPFSDPAWIVKTLIGSACQIFFLMMPAVIGYQLAIIRQTANGEDEKLPEYEGFGYLWVQGFLVTLLVGLLFMVPVGVFIAGTIGGVLTMGQGSGTAMVLIVGGVMSSLTVACLGLLFLMPALMLRYAMTQQVSALFDFSTAIGDIKQGFGDYLMIVLFPLIAMMLIFLMSLSGIVAIVTVPVNILILYIQARMIGNYYRLYFM